MAVRARSAIEAPWTAWLAALCGQWGSSRSAMGRRERRPPSLAKNRTSTKRTPHSVCIRLTCILNDPALYSQFTHVAVRCGVNVYSTTTRNAQSRSRETAARAPNRPSCAPRSLGSPYKSLGCVAPSLLDAWLSNLGDLGRWLAIDCIANTDCRARGRRGHLWDLVAVHVAVRAHDNRAQLRRHMWAVSVRWLGSRYRASHKQRCSGRYKAADRAEGNATDAAIGQTARRAIINGVARYEGAYALGT